MTRGQVTLRYPYINQHPALWLVSEICIRMHGSIGNFRVVKAVQDKTGVTVIGEVVKLSHIEGEILSPHPVLQEEMV